MLLPIFRRSGLKAVGGVTKLIGLPNRIAQQSAHVYRPITSRGKETCVYGTLFIITSTQLSFQ